MVHRSRPGACGSSSSRTRSRSICLSTIRKRLIISSCTVGRSWVESLRYHVNRSAECEVGKRPCQKPTSHPPCPLNWTSRRCRCLLGRWLGFRCVLCPREGRQRTLDCRWRIEALLKSPRKISEEGCTCRNSNLGMHCPRERSAWWTTLRFCGRWSNGRDFHFVQPSCTISAILVRKCHIKTSGMGRFSFQKPSRSMPMFPPSQSRNGEPGCPPLASCRDCILCTCGMTSDWGLSRTVVRLGLLIPLKMPCFGRLLTACGRTAFHRAMI